MSSLERFGKVIQIVALDAELLILTDAGKVFSKLEGEWKQVELPPKAPPRKPPPTPTPSAGRSIRAYP